MKLYDKPTEYIRDKIPEVDLYAGLAEEAAELAQAALKFARAVRRKNPVGDVSKEELYAALIEEYTDLMLYADVLEITDDLDIYHRKLLRWIDRLEAADEQHKV